MSIKKDYLQLNKMADEIVDSISSINEKYLDDNIEYPYNEVYILVDKYDLMLRKVLKKRYSLVNDVLNKINPKRKDMLVELDAPNKYEILNMASERNISKLLDFFKNNSLVDDESSQYIKHKMFPVIKNMELKNITYLYRECKQIVSQDSYSLGKLQNMFVGYIISNIMHDPARGMSGYRTSMLWTYEEVCKNILKEEVLEVDNNKMNR